MMILEWFQLSLVEWVLSVLLLMAFFVQLFYYLHYYRGILKQKKRILPLESEIAKPPVSIIICARNQALDLEQHLPDILNQDYPEFQVVVVNDASTDDSNNVLNRLAQSYPNLYHTFVPPGVQSVSAKKMAMTIGIKAAKYDVLLFTEADCKPVSNRWIASMMSQFDDKCDIVLGFSSNLEVKGFLKHLVSYDLFFTAIQFMGIAYSGKPYMGFGRNMAYRKELFFKNRGFASHLELESGDDDLFIEEIANAKNTRIQVTPESKMVTDTEHFWYHWKDHKINRLATLSYCKMGTRFRTGMELFSRFLFYALSLAVCLIGVINTNVALVAFSFFVLTFRLAVQLVVVHKTSKTLDEHRYYLALPFFDVLLPILNGWFRLMRIFNTDNSYTWRVLH